MIVYSEVSEVKEKVETKKNILRFQVIDYTKENNYMLKENVFLKNFGLFHKSRVV